MRVKTRKQLLATIKPHLWHHLRADNGDLPESVAAPSPRRLVVARAS
jgi:hypothetical protein